MTQQQSSIRAIEFAASSAALIDALEKQYAHMDQGEARAALENLHQPVWSNDELLDVFEVSHFEPPFVHVIRKTDGTRGTVVFVDSPRLYFSFQAEEKKENERSPQGV